MGGGVVLGERPVSHLLTRSTKTHREVASGTEALPDSGLSWYTSKPSHGRECSWPFVVGLRLLLRPAVLSARVPAAATTTNDNDGGEISKQR